MKWNIVISVILVLIGCLLIINGVESEPQGLHRIHSNAARLFKSMFHNKRRQDRHLNQPKQQQQQHRKGHFIPPPKQRRINAPFANKPRRKNVVVPSRRQFNHPGPHLRHGAAPGGVPPFRPYPPRNRPRFVRGTPKPPPPPPVPYQPASSTTSTTTTSTSTAAPTPGTIYYKEVKPVDNSKPPQEAPSSSSVSGYQTPTEDGDDKKVEELGIFYLPYTQNAPQQQQSPQNNNRHQNPFLSSKENDNDDNSVHVKAPQPYESYPNYPPLGDAPQNDHNDDDEIAPSSYVNNDDNDDGNANDDDEAYHWKPLPGPKYTKSLDSPPKAQNVPINHQQYSQPEKPEPEVTPGGFYYKPVEESTTARNIYQPQPSTTATTTTTAGYRPRTTTTTTTTTRKPYYSRATTTRRSSYNRPTTTTSRSTTTQQQQYQQQFYPTQQQQQPKQNDDQNEVYEFGFTEGQFKIPDFFRNFLSAPPSWIRLGDNQWK